VCVCERERARERVCELCVRESACVCVSVCVCVIERECVSVFV